MYSTNKYNDFRRFKSPNACPICGNEVPVSDLFCENCGMRMHNHRLSDRRGEINRLNRTSSTPADMTPPETAAYGTKKLSDMPKLKALVDGCKASYSNPSPDLRTEIEAFLAKTHESVNEIIAGDAIDREELERLGQCFIEERDFGLDRCTEAAKEIFNLGMFMSWANRSSEQKMLLAGVYAKEVAEAFKLVRYMGIRFMDLQPGVMGRNRGDGFLDLSNMLVAELKHQPSPFQIIDTITHELRHQYQFEAIQGYHKVPEVVVKEWMISAQIYRNDVESCCLDPWGYHYNPMEIDARYAGETVVRNITRDWFNAKYGKQEKAIGKSALRQRLVQEGYSEHILDKTVDNLLQLKGGAAAMLNSWLNKGVRPEFDNIEGISSRFLRERLKMKEPAIILSYGMLTNNPIATSKHLKSLL